MRKLLVLTALIGVFSTAFCQQRGFPFGQVTYRELGLTTYEKDTSAGAVVLKEFGEAYMDNEAPHDLVFKYHVKIKILNKTGLSQANIEIPLWKQDAREESVRNIKASSFTFENGTMQETKLEAGNVFTENRSKYRDLKKFAIPNVVAGCVIEYEYELHSPFKFNFRTWYFQSEIPKMESEYTARIPGNYVYNITLKGFYPLSKNENSLVRECYQPGGGYKADCLELRYGMKDIPAFKEEDYMTAKSNFISSINFELSELKHFDGRVDKITKTWKDAENELQNHKSFGTQLRRGKDIMDDHLSIVLNGETDALASARKIYTFIQGWYAWNDTYSMFSDLGVKKAFDQKTGNVADINLSLIAALRHSGIDAEPVILSTRSNGLPIEIHPVLSDFNYVIAKVNIGGKSYLVDATDDFHPFGLLPERCLNGKGRVLGEKESYWIDLKPAEHARQISIFSLKLDDDGVIRGKITSTYSGYEAINKRKAIFSFSNHDEFINDLRHRLDGIVIKGYEVRDADDINKPLMQVLDVEVETSGDNESSFFLFNPFLFKKWDANPFKSNERLYPVDFGAPIDFTIVFNLEYSTHFEIANAPEKTALALPNSGGRYLLDTQRLPGRISISNRLQLNKTVFSSVEYHYLKELFNSIIQNQNSDLLFKKKT